jgi:hypothetical protein
MPDLISGHLPELVFSAVLWFIAIVVVIGLVWR